MNKLLVTLALVLTFASPVLAGPFESGAVAVVNDDGNNSVRAEIFEYGPGKPLRFVTAILRMDASGAALVKWITPLRTS